MPVSWKIDTKKRRLLAKVIGDVRLDAINSAVDDSSFERGFDILADHTDVRVFHALEDAEAWLASPKQ